MNDTGIRLKSFLKENNIGQQQVAAALGVSKQYVNGLCNGKPLGKKNAALLQELYGVSAGWLLTGQGKRKIDIPDDGISIASEVGTEDTHSPLSPLNPSEQDLPKQSYKNGRPYYNVDFRCGFDILMNCQTTNPDYLIDFQPYNDCDLYCNAHGDSMHPTISSGDIVALKRIEDFRYLINGEIYAIVTSNGMRTIKRIRDNGDTFTLIADNQAISDQTIPKSLVTHAFLVRGSIKMF